MYRRRSVAILALLAAAILAVFGLERWIAGREKLNVLLITLDTTRADRLGCYGYTNAATPALDALARTGVLFSRAYTPVPLTLPSHATILTGMLPPAHGVRDNGRGALGPGIPTLTERFRSRGYRTAAFLGSFVLDKRFGLARGFEVYDDRMQATSGTENPLEMENPGNVVCDRALTWLAQAPRKPFFCWVHLYDPHAPYAPPEPFRSRHANPYDGEVAFMDSQVGRLVSFLDRQGATRRTLIVVCGDHGESLGEHREKDHGLFVYNATMRVPLILAGAQIVPSGKTEDRVAGLEDIAPTILRFGGWKRPPELGGKDLLAGLSEDRYCYGESQSANLLFGWAPLYSLTSARWKYIHCPDPELYDLEADPDELRNLATRQPAAAADLAARLEATRKAMAPLQATAVALDARALQNLRSLGYLVGNQPAATAGEEHRLRDPKAMVDVYEASLAAGELVDRQRYREAIALLAPIVARSPESVQIHELLAECYSTTRDYTQAVHHMQAALALTPDNRMLINKLGVTQMMQGDSATAAETFRRGSSLPQGPLEPTLGNGLSMVAVKMRSDLASALYRLGQFDEAAAECELALKDDPTYVEALSTLGNVRNQQGRFADASRHYQAVLSRFPSDPIALSNLGVALTRMGRMEEAIETHRKAVAANPASADCLMNLADALMADGRPEEAISHYREVVRAGPEQGRPVEALANALVQTGQDEEALSVYEQALKVQERPAHYHQVGMLQDRLGHLDEAVAAYRKALELNPRAMAPRNNLGLTLCRKKRYGDAFAVWREGLTLVPDNAFLLYNMAWWLATCPDPAVRNGREALSWAGALCQGKGAADPQFLDALAAAHAEAGEFGKAVETARRALARARTDGRSELAAALEQRLDLYAAGKPYHQ